MSQITFNVEGYGVNVSSHGYFIVFSPSIPWAKFITPYGELHMGPASALGRGIRYDGEHDDLNVDLEAPVVREAVEAWVRQRVRWLKGRETAARRRWEEAKALPVSFGGHRFFIGRSVEAETPNGWKRGVLHNIEIRQDRALTDIEYDEPVWPDHPLTGLRFIGAHEVGSIRPVLDGEA